MNSTPIYQFAKPTNASSKPPEYSEPILTPSYELRPCFINMIQERSFSGEGDANTYSHLQKFEQTCAYLRFAGMSDETLRWKLFLFSLTGIAKQWYKLTVGNMQGD
jgi:hypothetical protein